MKASEKLSSLINDAYRNDKPQVCRALQLLSDPIARLEARPAAFRAMIDRDFCGILNEAQREFLQRFLEQ